jgi:putative LysE/RhtB family amino acid efflux pump
LVTGAGIATADGAYAALAAFGVAAVSATLVALQSPLRIAGGVVLVWLGWRAMTAPAAQATAADRAVAGGPGAMYASAVGLTLTNPMTIMAFAAVFASAGLGAMDGARSALVATAGVACGSFAWWLALVSVVALVRHAVSDRAMLWVNRISGAAILLFGAVAVVTGTFSALGHR